MRPATSMALAALLVTLVFGACAGDAGPSSAASPARNGTLTIYAAASLKSALTGVRQAYEAGHRGTALAISTDSSAALETKIEQGARADLFLSADTTNPQKLVDKGLAAGPVVAFAGNQLTVIVPVDNPAGIASLAELGRSGVKVIGAEDSVPIAKYAKQLIANVAQAQDDPAAFSAAYAANVVSKEDNVAAIVSKIELGEGDVAIVYVTDAKASDKVRTIDVPRSVNVQATYGGVAIATSPNQHAARTFLDWLASPDGQAVFASFGFLPSN